MWIEVLLATFIIYIIWTNVKKPSNYPPGPWGLPIFGSFPFNPTKLEAQLSQLRKEHGNIFSWKVGSIVFVFLCEIKIIKEVMQNTAFANRPNISGGTLLEDSNHIGVIATNGQHWHSLRRFMLHHLRDLGMGKSKIVSAIQHEAVEFVKVLKKQAGKPAQVPHALVPSIINVLWQMIASKRYDLNDEKVINFHSLIRQVQNNFMHSMILDVFPWLKNYLPTFLSNKLSKKDVQIKLSNRLKEYFSTFIDDHIETIDDSNPRDFIDEYLIEMEKQKSDPESTMSYDDLVGCLADLFLAGLETTSLTIIWSIFYLAKFPEVQSKVQKEIDEAFSSDILVTFEDKARLPYTDAFLLEVLRYSTLASFGGFRSSFEDFKVDGYTIPKNSIVMATISDIHFDPKYFNSPKEFRPERFLNSNGKIEIPKEGFYPFGIGKRQCLGESLARMELFIFLVTMIQQLKFSVPPNKKLDISPMETPFFHTPRVEQDIMITIRN